MERAEGVGRIGGGAAATAAWLAADLLTADATLVETHFAWTLIGPSDVWKIKKPVAFGGLDCTTLPLRREACEAEVRRNSGWAPAVYHGFAPITIDGRGRHRIGGPGRPVEWAVHMRRLPDRAAADRRLAETRLSTADLDRVATCLAAYHRTASPAVDVAGHGSPGALARNIRCHAAWARPAVGQLINPAECRRIESRLLAFLDRHQTLLEARLVAGRVVDIHGDLRLDHVYIARHGVAMVDRLELGPRFGVADAAADVAMLAAGLESGGQLTLAANFVGAYLRSAEDPDVVALIGFYAAYCACQRACLLATLALDGRADAPTRARAARGARRCFLLALAATELD